MMKMGTWVLRSKMDPRWNADGRCSVGMFSLPSGAGHFIEQKKVELGEEPPEDLEYHYMKD